MKQNEIKVTTDETSSVSFSTPVKSVELPKTCETHLSARFKKNCILYLLVVCGVLTFVYSTSRFKIIELTDHTWISREAGDQLHRLGIYWKEDSRCWQVPATATTVSYQPNPKRKNK